MNDEIRARMKKALEMKGLSPYDVSQTVGFHRNYLWESFEPERRKGSLDGYMKIADKIGLDLHWLIDGTGEPFGSLTPPLSRDAVLDAIETILGRYLELDQVKARDAAKTVLDIVECPPDGASSTDTRDRIRIGVLGALRVYECR